MSDYVLSIEAEEDIFHIWSYLAERASVEIASRVEFRFYEVFDLLVKMPGLGHRRSDLTEYPVRFF